jgi:hypothetical protein
MLSLDHAGQARFRRHQYIKKDGRAQNRGPHRDPVEEHLRRGVLTARQIAADVGCDRNYVYAVAYLIGVSAVPETRRPQRTPRTHAHILADAAEQLTAQWRKQQARWGFED